MYSFGLPAFGEYPRYVPLFHKPSQRTVAPAGMLKLVADERARCAPDEAAKVTATFAYVPPVTSFAPVPPGKPVCALIYVIASALSMASLAVVVRLICCSL